MEDYQEYVRTRNSNKYMYFAWGTLSRCRGFLITHSTTHCHELKKYSQKYYGIHLPLLAVTQHELPSEKPPLWSHHHLLPDPTAFILVIFTKQKGFQATCTKYFPHKPHLQHCCSPALLSAAAAKAAFQNTCDKLQLTPRPFELNRRKPRLSHKKKNAVHKCSLQILRK